MYKMTTQDPEDVTISMDIEYNVTANMTSQNTSQDTSRGTVDNLLETKIAVQAVILALAIFGNVFVLVVLACRKRKLTRMHIFILHLSVADLLVAVFNILPQLIWEITGTWQAGDFLCRFIKFMQIFVMYLSTYILVLTAIDRRRAICNPMSSHTWTFRLVHLSVGCVYLLSAALSIPQAIIFQYQRVPNRDYKDCWVDFHPLWTLELYITSFTILIYILPLIILIYSYGSIYYTIFTRHKFSKVIGNNNIRGRLRVTESEGRQQKGIRLKTLDLDKDHANRSMVPRSSSFAGLGRAKIKTVRLTLVIIVAYITCWSPFFISQLWWLYDEHAPITNKALVVMVLLASLNSCCNPWIYLAFSGAITSETCRKPTANRKLLHGTCSAPDMTQSTGIIVARSYTRASPHIITPVTPSTPADAILT